MQNEPQIDEFHDDGTYLTTMREQRFSTLKGKEVVSVSCPLCKLHWGGYYRRDITPTRPMHFKCEKCFGEWDETISESKYDSFLKSAGKELVLREIEVLDILKGEE